LGNRLLSHREGRGVRRMAVDHRLHVGPLLVNRQVQQNLAGPLARAGQLLALVVHLANVLGLHESLGYHRRRAEHFLVVDTDGDVAVVGRREAAVVEPPADLTDVLFQLEFVHDSLITSWSKIQAQYASTGFFSGWNGAAASPPSLKAMRWPLPAPRLSKT